MKTGMRVKGFDRNGRTGHFKVHLCSVHIDDDGNLIEGPVSTHGIDLHSLKAMHGGKFRNFIESRRDEVMLHHEAANHGDDELKELMKVDIL